MIVTPREAAEVCSAVREAGSRGERLAIRGGGTHSGPAAASGASTVIVTTGLERVIDHQPENLVIEVEAGIRFAQLQRYLAEHRQRVPLDPPPEAGGDAATLGGILSANRTGPRRLRFGIARDWVIGTHLVRPDGAEVRSGGKVVKNVAGYDLSKLYLGARGRFGVLTRVALKLDPKPPAETWIQAQFADFETLQRALWTLIQMPVGLSGAISIGTGLAVVLEGLEELVPGDTERALESIARCGGLQPNVIDELPPRVHAIGARLRAVRIAVQRSRWASLAETARSAIGEQEGGEVLGYPSCGTLCVSWDGTADPATELTAMALRHDGHARLERWPRHEPAPALTSIDPRALRLEQALKAALDPQDRFVTEYW